MLCLPAWYMMSMLVVLACARLARAGSSPTPRTGWWGQGQSRPARCVLVPSRNRPRPRLQPGQPVRFFNIALLVEAVLSAALVARAGPDDLWCAYSWPAGGPPIALARSARQQAVKRTRGTTTTMSSAAGPCDSADCTGRKEWCLRPSKGSYLLHEFDMNLQRLEIIS